MDWRLIETAPKTGIRVLIWDADYHRYCLATWEPSLQNWYDETGNEGDGEYIRGATHWAPLPMPPPDKP